ncbi:MAG: NADPH:quinone oxidoreductase family protein [Rhodospirillales bacterium]
MKAARMAAFGDEGALEIVPDAPEPEAGAGELLVRVRAAGVNFADTLQIRGEYQVRPEPPFTPGLELSGEVITAGEDCGDWTAGDAVTAMVPHGAFAERAVVPSRAALAPPKGLDWAEAAAFPVAYGTSYMALADSAGLRRGETLLVLGAAGGVGSTAVELGLAMGARVIAVAGGPEKTAVLRERGVEDVIDHRAEDVTARVKELTGGRGADVIYDTVGGDGAKTVKAAAPMGRILVIGFASGAVPVYPANVVLVKGISVLGFHFGALLTWAPTRAEAAFKALADLCADGRIRPAVSKRYTLDEAAQALADIRARKIIGKAVIEV